MKNIQNIKASFINASTQFWICLKLIYANTFWLERSTPSHTNERSSVHISGYDCPTLHDLIAIESNTKGTGIWLVKISRQLKTLGTRISVVLMLCRKLYENLIPKTLFAFPCTDWRQFVWLPLLGVFVTSRCLLLTRLQPHCAGP